MSEFRQGGRGGFGGNRGGFRGGDRGGRPSFGGNRGGFRGDRGPVTMHKVVCDECKKPCEVPFLPTAGKPVYCAACFGGKRESGNDRGGDRFPRKTFGGGDYKTPPRTDFGADVNKVSGAEMKKMIESLTSKVDQLIKTVAGMANTKPAFVAEKAKVEVVETPVVKANPKTNTRAGKAVKKVSKK